MSDDDATPQPVDNGDRWRCRGEAKGFDGGMILLTELLGRCPPDCYPIRARIDKSSHGARVSVRVVFQTRGRPLESVASRDRRTGG